MTAYMMLPQRIGAVLNICVYIHTKTHTAYIIGVLEGNVLKC